MATAQLTSGLRAGAAWHGSVFGVGVMLGSLRVPLPVPRIGERWAELLEMPLMGLATVLAARWLLLTVGAELRLALALQGRSPAQYLGSRDPVSGAAYLALLAVFVLMPWWLGRRLGAL